MILHILRALFILLMAAVGYNLLKQPNVNSQFSTLTLFITLAIAILIVVIDVLAPRRKLTLFAGTFLGLVVGLLMAYALSFIVALVVEQIASTFPSVNRFLYDNNRTVVLQFLNLVVGVICCYFAISFILQTKDDFRFIVPYVEFSKQTRGARSILLDTSVLIDGRINDIAATGILESQLIVPRFVLNEVQQIADSADKLKRNRGRRGLDVLAKLQQNNRIEVILFEASARDDDAGQDVDQRLMALAEQLSARVLTNDFNLNKVAQLRGVDVININDLANAIKPVVLPGEKMTVRLIKPGEEPGQGVGYLEDGTMVVVEQGRSHVNDEIEFTVTSALQTSAGRMIFGRANETESEMPRKSHSRPAEKRPS